MAQSMPVLRTFSENMSPSDFEVFCAEELSRSGWAARVTTQSRDQGVDVVAEKAGIRVVLQCKLYSNPVGNKQCKKPPRREPMNERTMVPLSPITGTRQPQNS